MTLLSTHQTAHLTWGTISWTGITTELTTGVNCTECVHFTPVLAADCQCFADDKHTRHPQTEPTTVYSAQDLADVCVTVLSMATSIDYTLTNMSPQRLTRYLYSLLIILRQQNTIKLCRYLRTYFILYIFLNFSAIPSSF